MTGSNGLMVVTDTINGYIRLMTTTGKLLDCKGHEVCRSATMATVVLTVSINTL